MNRKSGFYKAQKTAMKNNLIALLDQTFPGANDFTVAAHICRVFLRLATGTDQY